jgi:hypothetical protein
MTCMKRHAATWPVRLGAGLILALLLTDVLAPSVAQAGCGDHLRTVRAGESQAESTPLPPAPGEPCNGPNCSSAPERQPLAPASAKVSLPDHEACLREAPTHDGFGESGWLRRDNSHWPARTSASIFHPPR